jgi:2-polyprenyl-3-methyl-5-hydroxy-6-metoxy-1,4-benzoquinol methylase
MPATSSETHEWRLFPEGTVPEYTRPEWYAGRERAPHLEQIEHRGRLLQTATFVAQAAFTEKLSTVVDLGAGDGGLLSLLGPSLSAWGYDLAPANLEAAKERNADVRYGDVVDGDIEWGQIAVCTEMLEHLVDPHAFVRRIAAHAQALVCSSPRNERAGHAYEFHTWAWDLEGYRTLVEQGGFKVLRQRQVDSFQVILAVKA